MRFCFCVFVAFSCVSGAAVAGPFSKQQEVVRSDGFASSSSAERDAALARVQSALASSELKDVTVVLGHAANGAAGEFVSFSKGKAGTGVVYEADSAQKWIMATLLIRDARRRGITLSQPVSTWPTAQGAPWVTKDVSETTLAQFLSFTSGFEDPPPCASIARGTWTQCLPKLTTSKQTYPRRYSYGTHHMMVALAGLSHSDNDAHPSDTLLKRFQQETKLLSSTKHDSDKPLSLLTTAGDYASFLRALATHQLLTADEEASMFKDHIGTLDVAKSPADRGRIDGTWHYGLGNWCELKEQACGALHHSAGARGFFPFYDVDSGVYGVVAHNAGLGRWDRAYAFYQSVKNDLPLVTQAARK